MKKYNRDTKLILVSSGITLAICILISLIVVPHLIESAALKATLEPEKSMLNNSPYIKFIQVGDEIEFGNDLRTGKKDVAEPLSWHVEKIEGIKAYLVLDDYLLVENCNDCNDYWTSWDRTWINERFYNDWFSDYGREQFIPSETGVVPLGKAIVGDKVFCVDARDRDDGLREVKPAMWLLIH